MHEHVERMVRRLLHTPDSAPSTPAPAALLTFLIADMRGYTRFTVSEGDEAAARLADRFAGLAEEVVGRCDGRVIELRGDEVLAVFLSSRNALRAALALQAAAREATRSDGSLPLHLGIGLDAGEAVPVRGGYRGAALNLAARLCSLAGAGEVLASDAVAHLARKVEGVGYRDRGQAQLKGFADPVSVLEVVEDQGALVEEAAGIVNERERPGKALLLPIGGFLGALPGNTLVGRETELAQVLETVDAAAAGAGRLVLLAGESGAGKTRLAQEVTIHLRNRSFLLAAGSCFESKQSVPYYPFLDVLTSLYDMAPSHVRSQVSTRWPYLGRLLPEAGVDHLPSTDADGDDQQRLFRSITGFVQALAQTAPLAILLDDLHWADGSSLDLLGHLAMHTRGDSVLLLGTYRDVEVGRQHPLERTLHDLHRHGLTERVPIRRLDGASTADLVAAILGAEKVSPEFTALLYRHTEGNPFFTQEVLRALVERGDVYREDGVWARRSQEEIEVPESVRAVVGQRLSSLQPETQEILREASVLGQSFTFDDLLAMTGRDEDTIDAALAEAVDSSLVRALGKETYSFGHALIHGALYAELSSRRRRKLHRAAGDVLEGLAARKREQRLSELTWHLLEGDERERALPYVMHAGEQAEAVFAHAEAASRFRTAVELAQDIEDRAAEARALERLGRSLEAQSRPDESLHVLKEAAEAYRDLGDVEGEGRVTAGIGGALMHLGRAAEAVARLQAMITELEAREPGVVLARLSVQLSAVLYGNGQYGEAFQAAERAANVATLVGDAVTLVSAENYKGSVLMQTGKPDEARQVFEAILPVSETLTDLGTRAHTVNDLGFTHFMRGCFAESERCFERALELQRRRDSPGMIAFELCAICWVRFHQGKWQEARRASQEGLDLIQGLPPSWQIPFQLYSEGLVEAYEGDWEGAINHLQQMIDMSSGSHVLLPLVHRVLAEHDILDGRPDLACARLQPLQGEPGEETFYTAMMLPALAWAHIELDELAQADVLVSHLAGSVSSRFPLVLVDALWVQGMLLTRQGAWGRAQQALEEAVTLARSMPYPYAEAMTLHEWGVMAARMGDGSVAQERLLEARATLNRLGARPALERTERALIDLASGPAL